VTASARWNGSFGNEAVQFDTEMAAPVEIEDPKWHRSEGSHEECGWKQGESALGAGKSACGSKEG
jgi:hypothetical protein